MKKFVAVCLLVWLGHEGAASAAGPDWCKSASSANYELKDLSSQDVERVISTLAMATCKPTAEATANKAAIEKSRQAWGKKLGMNDSDWADAVAFANVDGRPSDPALSTKDLAKLTPIDQYVAIRVGFSDNGAPFENYVYLADMLESNLTEVGRLGYIEACTHSPSSPDEGDAVRFAICQGDIDVFDAAKFSTQLRSDTAHKPEQKMRLRLQAYELPAKLAEHRKAVEQIYAKDAAYKKLWDAAKKGRAAWKATFASQQDLLALALTMDTFQFSRSRKAFEGCAAATEKALHATVTAKVPAKLFADAKDIRMDPYAGVAKAVGAKMLDIPELAFVAGPYIICHGQRGSAEFLSYFLDNIPGQRGPRAGAFTEITRTPIVLDDMNAKINYSTSWNHPFSRGHGSLGSAGGAVKTVKETDGVLVVALEKLLVKRKECVQSHRTNRITRINRDGTLDYELVCDKMGVRTYDETWADFRIDPAYKSVLKPGVLFSAVQHEDSSKGADILALWPKKDAALPTMVLGAPVK